MPHSETKQLRVLIVDAPQDRFALVEPIIAALGHDVIACEPEVAEAAGLVCRLQPDLAIVGLGHGGAQALLLIDRIARVAVCPVVVHGHAIEAEFVKEASERGVFAHVRDSDENEWRDVIEIVLRRFSEYRDLEGAFARRAITERAKGILMERHAVDEQRAFGLLRRQARNTNRRLVDVAAAVLEGHLLLPASADETAPTDEDSDVEVDRRRAPIEQVRLL